MEQTKRCPYCGEEILASAKKCKHCHEWLEEPSDDNTSVEETIETKPQSLKVEQTSTEVDDNETITEEDIESAFSLLNPEFMQLSWKNWKNWHKCGFLVALLLLVLMGFTADSGFAEIDLDPAMQKVVDKRGEGEWIYPIMRLADEENVRILCILFLLAVNVLLCFAYGKLRKITAPCISLFPTPYSKNAATTQHLFLAQLLLTIFVFITITLDIFLWEWTLMDILEDICMAFMALNLIVWSRQLRLIRAKSSSILMLAYGILVGIEVLLGIPAYFDVDFLDSFGVWAIMIFIDGLFVLYIYDICQYEIAYRLAQLES